MFYTGLFFLLGAQVITHIAFQISSGELPKPFNFPAPTGKWDLFSQPPCKENTVISLQTRELPNVGKPASFVLLSSRNAPVPSLRLYLSIMCPSGLPGSAPARMLWGDSLETLHCSLAPLHIQSGSPPLFSVFPWSMPVLVQQSHMAWPLRCSSAPVLMPYLLRPVQHHLAMPPSGLQWCALIATPAPSTQP